MIQELSLTLNEISMLKRKFESIRRISRSSLCKSRIRKNLFD